MSVANSEHIPYQFKICQQIITNIDFSTQVKPFNLR